MKLFAALISSVLLTSCNISQLWEDMLAQAPSKNPELKSDIELVLEAPTPQPNVVETFVVYPTEEKIEKHQPVEIQVNLMGVYLGYKSDFPRASEIRNSSKGQSFHIFIDDSEYFEAVGELIDFPEKIDKYFEQEVLIKLPSNLPTGLHCLRVLPCRSFGESFKGNKAMFIRTFYIQEKVGQLNTDLNRIFLTYNEPQGTFRYKVGKPILLDFFISNGRISSEGYKVRLNIDNDFGKTLSDIGPYYIYNLKPGKHNIQLELLDPSGNIVKGSFNKVSRQILVQE